MIDFAVEENNKIEFAKQIKHFSKMPLERRWNAAKHSIWLNGITTSRHCRIVGCACKYTNEERFCLYETSIYDGIVKELEDEFQSNYPKVGVNTFGVQFLIRQIALNAIRLMRANAHEAADGEAMDKSFHRYYENPTSEYIRRLINQTMSLLRRLGLSPLQLIEKESWEISKSIERTIAKMQIKPSEVQMEKSVTTMEKKPRNAIS